MLYNEKQKQLYSLNRNYDHLVAKKNLNFFEDKHEKEVYIT